MALKGYRQILIAEYVSLNLKPMKRGGMIVVDGNPLGILLQDVVSIGEKRPDWFYYDEVWPEGGWVTVCLMKRGCVVTDRVDQTADYKRGDSAYLRGDIITPKKTRKKVGHFQSPRFDGFARVFIDVT